MMRTRLRLALVLAAVAALSSACCIPAPICGCYI